MGKIDYKMMDKFVDEECHLIINALSKDSFSKCNIPGSINIPLLSLKRNPKDPKKSENIEDIIKKHLKDFPKFKGKKLYDLPIIVYCKNKDCKTSEKLMKILLDNGFKNVSEYPGGMIEWLRMSKDKVKTTNKKGGSDKNSQYNLDIDSEKVVYDKKKYDHNLKSGELSLNGEVKGEYKKNNTVKLKDDSSDKESSDSSSNKKKSSDKESSDSSDKKKSSDSSSESSSESSSSEEDSSDSSEEEDIKDDIDTMKKDIDNIKYKKHKLKLVCMNDITPKVYDERFRGWIFTYWN